MKKIIAIVLLMVLILTAFSGCVSEKTVDEKSSDVIQAEKAERTNKQKSLRVGEPSITIFNEANQVKEIYEKRDNGELLCHAYTKNIEGKFIYLGISKGFGVNASIQFSNPVKVVDMEDFPGVTDWSGSSSPTLMPQAEPNGLFMPEGLMATYINLLNEETGEFSLLYIEDNLNVYESKLPKRLVAEWSLPADY